jgi:serine/threonine protein kinase
MANVDDLSGRVIDGKYEVHHLLGRGGMGAVYAGTHLQLERQVAVKILRADLVADANAAARFVREARAAARIEHPNAVSVYDFGQLDGGAYLVMEYVDGISLRAVMREQGRLPLATVVDLIQQISAAVGAAHARGIIHRDIKPENVMVRTEPDGNLTVKVVDFGLAKLLSGDAATQLSNQSELIGTPKYMAPEQFSDGVVDGRVDVYAIGIVLYELLAGRTPFEGSFTEIIGKHLYTEPPPLSSFDAGVPEAVEGVVRRALAKSPGERTAEATELARELTSACWSDTGEAAHPTVNIASGAATSPQATDAFSGPSIDVAHTAPMPAPVTSPNANETRYAANRIEEETRVRPEDQLPTVHVPDRGAMPPYEAPPLATAPAALKSRVPLVAAATLSAIVVAGAAAFWASRPGDAPPPTVNVPAQPAPVAPQATPPTPVAPRPPEPAPVERPGRPERSQAPADPRPPAAPPVPERARPGDRLPPRARRELRRLLRGRLEDGRRKGRRRRS